VVIYQAAFNEKLSDYFTIFVYFFKERSKTFHQLMGMVTEYCICFKKLQSKGNLPHLKQSNIITDYVTLHHGAKLSLGSYASTGFSLCCGKCDDEKLPYTQPVVPTAQPHDKNIQHQRE